jgi:alkanesulfonate monooxygenase SsuD/methylene tetrahydromethanopterin reductase-like flavin-dependent oxidoreductase (luciferase family)
MIFDIFHSLGRVDSLHKPYGDREVFAEFFRQVDLAEALGYSTIWVAESHFSSEVQKNHLRPVIPHYEGEVGLNTDSFQLASWVQQRTKKIAFGTAITNIVGGNGGPIAVADRVRMLAWHNYYLTDEPRYFHIGIASGRFPYINRPFGIVPKDSLEEILWPVIQKFIFFEALEIFLRLSRGETISSRDLTEHWIPPSYFSGRQWDEIVKHYEKKGAFIARHSDKGVFYQPRWSFESLRLVPDLDSEKMDKFVRFVLGSHEPRAREIGLKFSNLDIFNLSFTPPHEIEKTHCDMGRLIERYNRDPMVTFQLEPWQRSRMPRTVLVFIDTESSRAQSRAKHALEVYRQAMMGTVQLPDTEELLARALVGTPEEIIAQLHPDDPHGFNEGDRLMLWFEFNQSNGDDILGQMRLFAEKVIPHLRN